MPSDSRRNQDELLRRIQINRAKWSDNARNSPVANRGRLVVVAGTVTGYAVAAGLAAMMLLSDGLQPNRPDRVAELEDLTTQPSAVKANVAVSPKVTAKVTATNVAFSEVRSP